MSKQKILTSQQEDILHFLAKSNIFDLVCFTGGTALSAVYFQHRLSTDIDLFCEDIIDPLSLQIFTKSLKEELKIKNIEYQLKMNRNLFLVDGLKLEIVYFPFPALFEKKKFFGVSTDSLDDIAVNKVLALYQRNDPKDVFDLYFLLSEEKFSLDILLKNVELKFGEKLNEDLFHAKIQKNLENIDILEPLALDKNIIPKIKDFFTTTNTRYVSQIFS